jgi:2-iminobutanoate/2-iminopropanoate deaminase
MSAKPNAAPPLSRYRILGDTVYVSEQVPVKGREIIEGNFEAQVRQTSENLRAALEAAGSSFDPVVKCNCYLRREGDVAECNRIYREFFAGVTELTARTTLIAAPPNPKFDVEVECLASRGRT